MIKIDDYLKQNISFIPMVVGFLVTKDKVLLGQRKKVSNNLGLNIVSGIGGKVGDSSELAGETNEDALVRELKEEIKATPLKWEYFGQVRHIFSGKVDRSSIVYIYKIYEWQGEPMETEVIKPMWYEQNNLPTDQMWDDNLYWVSNILKGETVNMTFLYDEAEKKVVETIHA